MTRVQQARFDMLVKVGEFGSGHKALFPEASTGGQAFATIAAEIAALRQYMTEQVSVRARAQRVKAETRATVYAHLKAIARTARRVTKQDTIGSAFRMGGKRSAASLLALARAFAKEAEERQEEFIRLGLPPTFVADLVADTDELDQAVNVRLASVAGRRQVEAGIEVSLKRGLEAVRDLDAVVPNARRLDPARLAGWYGARRIAGIGAPVEKASAPTDTGASGTEDVEQAS